MNETDCNQYRPVNAKHVLEIESPNAVLYSHREMVAACEVLMVASEVQGRAEVIKSRTLRIVYQTDGKNQCDVDGLETLVILLVRKWGVASAPGPAGAIQESK